MASFKTSSLAILGAFAATAMAHGTVTGFAVDGKAEEGYKLDYYYLKQNGGTPPSIAAWSAENLDNGFVDGTGYQSADINCHKNAAPGATTASVAAGGTVDFQWSAWPESHFGPVFTYVAKCAGDCADADKTTLKWVKIDEAGYDVSTKTWAATDLIKNSNKWTTKVPSTLAAGNYVFRHEIIAMHGAGSLNGAQNYPQCFNIAVTGSGTENPEGVLGTELYKATDAGIQFNPYGEITSYEIPGPALFGSSGSGGGSTTPAPPTESTPVTPAPEESSAVPAPVESSAPAPVTPSPVESAAPVTSAPAADDGAADEPEECPVAARRRARRAARAARRHARDF